MSSSPYSPTPLKPLQLDGLDDIPETPSLLMYDGRLPFRVRPRHLMILLFTAVVAILVLFSLLSESSPDQPTSVSPQNAVTITSSTVEPVVFALIMYSGNSAREGAILLKVTSLTRIDIETR